MPSTTSETGNRMRFSWMEARERHEIRLSGEFDIATAPQLSEALQPKIKRGGDLVVDLAAVTFMDGAGLRPLLLAAHGLAGRGRLVLKSPSSPVFRLLGLVAVERFRNLEIDGGSSPSGRREAHVRGL